MTYMILSTNYKYSHQPYLFNNYLLFTASNTISNIIYSPLSDLDTPTHTKNILWQLYISELNSECNLIDTKFINTGYDIICSPILYKNNNKYYLSFIGGKLIQFGIKYNLIKCEYDLEKNIISNIEIIKENCFYGCINENYTIYGNRKDNILNIILNDNRIIVNLQNKLNYIYRAVYLSNNNNIILITGNYNRQYKTLIYNIRDNIFGELQADNLDIYKSTYNDKYCIFSNKLNDKTNFEERQLILTTNFTITYV